MDQSSVESKVSRPQAGRPEQRPNKADDNLVSLVISEAIATTSSRSFWIFLAALLGVDGVFIAIYIFSGKIWSVGTDQYMLYMFNISKERSFGEYWEYIKTLICVGTFIACHRRTGQPIYSALAIIFGVLLFDNAFAIHEAAGAMIEPSLGATSILFASAPQTLAELLFLSVLGFALLALLWRAFSRSDPTYRAKGCLMALLLIVLVGCGVGFDMLHAMAPDDSRLDRLLALMEDGGELVTLSLAAGTAVFLGKREGLFSRLPRAAA